MRWNQFSHLIVGPDGAGQLHTEDHQQTAEILEQRRVQSSVQPVDQNSPPDTKDTIVVDKTEWLLMEC